MGVKTNCTIKDRPTPQGVGGLKCMLLQSSTNTDSPTPQGVGGLKYISFLLIFDWKWSHPTRGGWIEIKGEHRHGEGEKSHPTRGGWIEI